MYHDIPWEPTPRIIKILGILLIIFFIVSCVTSCYKHTFEGHKCKWSLCPYKGVIKESYTRKVLQQVGSDDCEEYWLDILHLEYPTEEYEQLEERFNDNKLPWTK